MKRRNRNCHCLVEPLEPRSLLSGYATTEVTWIPEGSSGLYPQQITNSGLFTVESGNTSPANPSYYVSTVSRRRAYAVLSNFGLIAIGTNGELLGTNTENYEPEIDVNGVIAELPNPTGVSAITGNDDYSPGFIVASVDDNGRIVGLIEGNDPGIVTQFFNVAVQYNPSTNQSTAINAIGELGFGSTVCANDSGLIAFSDTGSYMDNASVYNPESGSITALPVGATSSVVAINDTDQVLGSNFLYNMDTGSLITFTGSRRIRQFQPKAINDDGVIVGSAGFFVSVRNHHAWERRAAIFENGQLTDLNTLATSPDGKIMTEAVSINGSSQVLADDMSSAGADHIYVLTPK